MVGRMSLARSRVRRNPTPRRHHRSGAMGSRPAAQAPRRNSGSPTRTSAIPHRNPTANQRLPMRPARATNSPPPTGQHAHRSTLVPETGCADIFACQPGIVKRRPRRRKETRSASLASALAHGAGTRAGDRPDIIASVAFGPGVDPSRSGQRSADATVRGDGNGRRKRRANEKAAVGSDDDWRVTGNL